MCDMEREFDCLVTFVADTVVRWSCRHGGIRVDTLQQALCERYGPEHFRRKRNADMLAEAVEYLIYTNRVSLSCCEELVEYSMILSNKMHLLDGSFISGVTPYVDIDSVMKHPLWGSHLLLNNEDAVIRGHKDYIKAGADFLTTITYQASIGGFQKYLNLDYDQSFELIKKSVIICRQAIAEENVERNIQIMGSVGPYGASLRDCSEYNGNYIDTINLKELYDWHKPRIQALVEAGVDVMLFETIPSVIEATILLSILTEFPNQKACLSFSCKDGNHLSHGETFSSAIEMFWSNDYRKQLIAIGMNCLHPKFITPLLMSVKTKNVNFITYPNGGGIWDIAKNCYDDTQIYKVSIDDLNIWNKKGLKIFGGCCKTDAIEIARLRSLIDDLHLL